jgi:Ca2+-binding EF-hand superfamily protein
MRNTVCFLTIVGAAVLAPAAATAQDAANDQPTRAERRQRVLQAFDADGDGQLSDEERAKARAELGGQSDRADRPRGERQGRGPRPDGPPGPDQLFDRFDENHDNQLSREEFMKLTATMREMRQRRAGGPPDARGQLGRDDRLGPTRPENSGDRPPRRRARGGEGGFRPLENPGPPPPVEQRGFRGPDGERGARGQGAAGRGPQRMRFPNPERLFNAFDANGDDQLSREEFTKLTATLRERMAGMRERGIRPGPPEDGGPSRFRGPEGPGPRPQPPPRPEFESADPPEPGADGNSA